MEKSSDITAEKGDQVMKDLVFFKKQGARALGECALAPDPGPLPIIYHLL